MKRIVKKQETINKLTEFVKANNILNEAKQTINSLNEFLTNISIAAICDMMDWNKDDFTFDNFKKDKMHDEYYICVYPKCDISRYCFIINFTNDSIEVSLKFRIDESKHY